MSRVDKGLVHEALLDRLRTNISAVTRSQLATQAGALNQESRQENPKDTRAIEASYLARGLAERAELLEVSVHVLESAVLREFGSGEAIEVGALV